MPIAIASSRNGRNCRSGTNSAAVTIPIQMTSPKRITAFAPNRPAARPKARAPKTATNWTTRYVASTVPVSKPSSSTP